VTRSLGGTVRLRRARKCGDPAASAGVDSIPLPIENQKIAGGPLSKVVPKKSETSSQVEVQHTNNLNFEHIFNFQR
jgi:hypothetical protein